MILFRVCAYFSRSSIAAGPTRYCFRHKVVKHTSHTAAHTYINCKRLFSTKNPFHILKVFEHSKNYNLPQKKNKSLENLRYRSTQFSEIHPDQLFQFAANLTMRHYLNLPEILSQVWLDQIVIFMVLATLKLYFFSRALVTMIMSVRDSSVPLCYKLESLASGLSQVPDRMSRMTSSALQVLEANSHTLIEKSVFLSATIAKSIVSLLLELYLGTLTCLITALVKGTLELVSEILEDITQFIQKSINAVLKEFNTALSGLSSIINKVISAVTAIESLFSASDKSGISTGINKVNLTVATLKNITIPTTWISDIEDLANEVPDFEEVLSNVSAFITAPITDATARFSNVSFNFSLSEALETQNTNQLSTSVKLSSNLAAMGSSNATSSVCKDVDIVLGDAMSITNSFGNYMILGLGIATVAYTVFIGITTYLHQRKRKRLYEVLAETNNPTAAGNAIDQFDHGLVAVFTSRFKPETQWLFSYVATTNLTKCLMLGLLGWLVVLLQYLTLRQTAKVLKFISTNGVLSSQTKEEMAAHFTQYLSEAQISLNTSVNAINEALFSSLHNSSSDILNEIGYFQTSVNDTVNTVFGSSFLAKPLRSLIYCTIGRKVDTIETGLEWVEENTWFKAPVLDQANMKEIFMDSTTDVSDTSSEVAQNILDAVQNIIASQKKVLWKEFLISTAFVAVWVFYLLIGLLVLSGRRPKVQASESRLSTQAISWPSQLCEEGQREYSYPYNDPYGVPYIGTPDILERDASKQRITSSENTSLQSSSCQHTAIDPHIGSVHQQMR